MGRVPWEIVDIVRSETCSDAYESAPQLLCKYANAFCCCETASVDVRPAAEWRR